MKPSRKRAIAKSLPIALAINGIIGIILIISGNIALELGASSYVQLVQLGASFVIVEGVLTLILFWPGKLPFIQHG